MGKIATILEQSRKLAKILPIKTADVYYWYSGTQYYLESMNDGDFVEGNDIPAWSLDALLGVLPKGTNISISDILNEVRYSCWNDYGITYADNPVDACVAMIETLHELKML